MFQRCRPQERGNHEVENKLSEMIINELFINSICDEDMENMEEIDTSQWYNMKQWSGVSVSMKS